MKFGQLIEYTMRNIFLEKSFTKCWENSPRLFSEKLKLIISLNQQSKNLQCYYCMPSWGLLKYYETKLQNTYFYLLLSFFKKTRGLELVSLPHLLHNFWREMFLLLYSTNWPSFIVRSALLYEILSNMCIATVS